MGLPSGAVRILVVAGLAAAAVIVWWNRAPADEQAIRARLGALRAEINATAAAGVESASRAAQIGGYFTEDAVVDLGQGATPISGRATIMGMAFRLQPRTAAFRLDLDDVSVDLAPGGASADVTLTASFILRSMSTGEESRDAREFVVALTKAAGTWRIARVTAVETLR